MKLSNVTLGLENKFFPEVLSSEDHLLYYKQEMKVDPFSGYLKHFGIRVFYSIFIFVKVNMAFYLQRQ